MPATVTAGQQESDQFPPSAALLVGDGAAHDREYPPYLDRHWLPE
jgi:hypothetical protein